MSRSHKALGTDDCVLSEPFRVIDLVARIDLGTYGKKGIRAWLDHDSWEDGRHPVTK